MNNRRQFLKQCAYTAAAGASIAPLTSTQASCKGQSDYRAIVQIYLQGGNDINMMIPNDDAQYNRYQQIRGTSFALNRNSLVPIQSDTNGPLENYAMHPKMAPLKEIYEQGDLAFVANVGALRAPLDKNEFLARTKPIPPRLFAHNSQTEFVLAGLPLNGERVTGWGGRLADACNLAANDIPVSLSMAGKSLWLRGAQSNQYSYGSGVNFNEGFNPSNSAFKLSRLRTQALKRLQQQNSYGNVFTNEVARKFRQSLSTSQSLDNVATAPISFSFVDQNRSGSLGSQLRNALNLIYTQQQLGQSRQLMYAQSSGWDFHDNALFRHDANLTKLAQAMADFQRGLEEIGMADKVTTMTISDFGRTLTGNGNAGTDHAWGNTQMIMGKQIEGGRVYGQFPKLDVNDDHFLDGRGILVPTLATDQLSASAASWFLGLSDPELETMFPNLKNFNQKTIPVYR